MRLSGRVCGVVVGLVLAVVMSGAMAARAAAAEDIVKYYVVTAAFQGQPENLWDIAARLLGDKGRASEILDLNLGRAQPDGARLADPATLHPGWLLVLPWDAYGADVRLGALPASAPPAAPTPKPTGKPTGATTKTPVTMPPPTPPPTTAAPTQNSGSCTAPTRRSSAVRPWAQERLAPTQAWAHSKGKGVVVAVIDSGVDAKLPQLAGRISDGVNIASGKGIATTDCVGSGTAMAALIAADQGDSGPPVGMAPEATILPVLVSDGTAAARPESGSTGIDVAVAAGANVIALGAMVDTKLPAVAGAIDNAIRHNVVVVAGATPQQAADTRVLSASDGLLRVAAVDEDNKLAVACPPGSVDVVAPGVGVTSLGPGSTGRIAGSGTEYAVALVAGTAALVRAAYPQLSAAEVTRRVLQTADHKTQQGLDALYGWGLINPNAALTQPLTGSGATTPPGSDPDPSAARRLGTTVLYIALAVALALVLAMLLAVGLRSRYLVGRFAARLRGRQRRATPARIRPMLTLASLSIGERARRLITPRPRPDGPAETIELPVAPTRPSTFGGADRATSVTLTPAAQPAAPPPLPARRKSHLTPVPAPARPSVAEPTPAESAPIDRALFGPSPVSPGLRPSPDPGPVPATAVPVPREPVALPPPAPRLPEPATVNVPTPLRPATPQLVTATDQDAPDLPVDRTSTPEQRQAVRSLLGHRYDMHARTVINQLAQRPALRPSAGESGDAVVTDLATVAAFAAADEVFANSRSGPNSAEMACLLSGVRRLPTHLGAVLASWTYDPRLVWRTGEVVAAAVMLLAVAPPGRPPVRRPILAVWSAGGRRSSGLVEDGERILFAPGSRFRVIGIEGPDPRQPTVVLLRELTGHEGTSPAAAIEERDRRALESLRRVINAEVASVPSG